ncbi:hypothetical protein BZA77DRAFT_366242 [Pyronema omphalodes]|nr:hypothetical protein BZA77DRAFT_366242 [Pyronema omphalodes]
MKPYDPPSEKVSKKHHDENVYNEKTQAIKEDFQHIPEPEQQGGIYRLMKVWVSNLVFGASFGSQDAFTCLFVSLLALCSIYACYMSLNILFSSSNPFLEDGDGICPITDRPDFDVPIDDVPEIVSPIEVYPEVMTPTIMESPPPQPAEKQVVPFQNLVNSVPTFWEPHNIDGLPSRFPKYCDSDDRDVEYIMLGPEIKMKLPTEEQQMLGETVVPLILEDKAMSSVDWETWKTRKAEAEEKAEKKITMVPLGDCPTCKKLKETGEGEVCGVCKRFRTAWFNWMGIFEHEL